MQTPEMVLVAGPPGGGKSTFTQSFLGQDYTRINRDDIGGSTKEDSLMYQKMQEAYDKGDRFFVLDNVYATKESRLPAYEIARKLGLPVRVLWLQTTAAQAQFFAARRQVLKYGKLFTLADYKEHRNDPGMFPPAAQFAYWKKVEPPQMGEHPSLIKVDLQSVTIQLGPGYVNKAVLFDYDGTLRVTKSGRIYPCDPDDVVLLPGRRENDSVLGSCTQR